MERDVLDIRSIVEDEVRCAAQEIVPVMVVECLRGAAVRDIVMAEVYEQTKMLAMEAETASSYMEKRPERKIEDIAERVGTTFSIEERKVIEEIATETIERVMSQMLEAKVSDIMSFVERKLTREMARVAEKVAKRVLRNDPLGLK